MNKRYKGSLEMRAEAWHQLWPVLVELGVNEKCPAGMTGLESAIEFVRGLAAERDEARSEVAALRAELSGLETYANRVTAERDRYRLALEAIAESDFAWFARIKARETLALATPGEGGGAR